MPMSEFVLPLLLSVLVPGCALALLLWLAHLEDTLDDAVLRRSARAAAERAEQGRSEQTLEPAPAPAGQASAQ